MNIDNDDDDEALKRLAQHRLSRRFTHRIRTFCFVLFANYRVQKFARPRRETMISMRHRRLQSFLHCLNKEVKKGGSLNWPR